MENPQETTRLLQAVGRHDSSAARELFVVVYDALRALAGSFFRRQPTDHTLQPTALINEAFIKLVGQTDWQNRAHFLAVAASAMRSVLTDHARRRASAKRGGRVCRLTLDEAITPVLEREPILSDLEEALQRLSELDARQGRIVELRFFGGLTVDEVAHVLGLSVSTVEEDWRMARAWIRRELTRERSS